MRIHERARLVTESRSYSGEVSERAYLRIYLCAGHGACQTDEGAAATRRLKPRHTRADPSFHRSIVFSPWYLIAVPTPHFPGSLIARRSDLFHPRSRDFNECFCTGTIFFARSYKDGEEKREKVCDFKTAIFIGKKNIYLSGNLCDRKFR